MSNTLSRLIKVGKTSELRSLDCRAVGEAAAKGVREFQPRSLTGRAEEEASPPQESEPEPSAPPPETAPQPEPPAADLEDVRREAFQHGFSEGEQNGREASGKKLEKSLDSLGRMTAELAAYKDRLRLDVEKEVVELAFAVARRIVRRELTVDPTLTVGIVRACLEEFATAEVRRLEIHPDDAGLIAPYFEGRPGPVIDIVPNEAVGRGGAVFETTQGRLDARLEAQIQEIENGLADRWIPSGETR